MRKLLVIIFIFLNGYVFCQNCGAGTLCNNLEYPCCSQYGWCGTSEEYCGRGCQSEFGIRCNNNNQTTSQRDTNQNVPFIIRECIIENTVALTFDDGPFMYTNTLLDILKMNDVRGTFFVNGINRWNIDEPFVSEIVKRAYDDGHQIASHTWSHLDLTVLTEDRIMEEMTLLDDSLKRIIGKVPKYMRPPYGNINEMMARVMTLLGYKMVLWNIDSNDWGVQGGVRNITELFDENPVGKSIILQHDTLEHSVESLTQLFIDFLKERQLNIVTVAECLGDNPYIE